MVNWILDHTGAPECLWHLCLEYYCYLLNRLSHSQLKGRTPHERAIGETPDISCLLQFHFYQPIFYYEKTESFPCSKERLGWWVGVAESQGDALTYKILTIENDVITRSVICPADNPIHPNRRVRFRDDPVPRDVLESEADVLDIDRLKLPVVDPSVIIGTKFIKEIHGHPHKCEVMEELDDSKYIIRIGDGQRGDIVMYNEILNRMERGNNPEDNDQVYTFETILDHRMAKNRKYEVLVQWSTGEAMWEPLCLMIKNIQSHLLLMLLNLIC